MRGLQPGVLRAWPVVGRKGRGGVSASEPLTRQSLKTEKSHEPRSLEADSAQGPGPQSEAGASKGSGRLRGESTQGHQVSEEWLQGACIQAAWS